jgi:serine/threonine-protein kinase
MDPPTVACFLVPLLDALDYSHQRGVIHRDIKPSNIILDARGRPYLMDFGIAKTGDSLLQTRTGSVLGTPAYLAPEQASGKTLDGRADLYALGVTLYEMLAGRHPFRAANALETMLMRLTTDPEPLSNELPGVDPRLEAIVARALAREREERFSTAAEMRKSLLEVACEDRDGSCIELAAQTPDPQPLGATPPAIQATRALRQRPAPARRRRVVVWVAAVAVFVVLSIVAFQRLLTTTLPATESDGRRRDADSTLAVSPETPANGHAEELSAPSNDIGPVGDRWDAAADVEREASPELEPSRPEVSAEMTRAAPAPAVTRRRPVRWPRLLDTDELRTAAAVPETCAGEIVNLSLVIGEDGGVKESRVLAATLAECGEAARAAVEGYRYNPAVDVEGNPVEATIAVAIEF